MFVLKIKRILFIRKLRTTKKVSSQICHIKNIINKFLTFANRKFYWPSTMILDQYANSKLHFGSIRSVKGNKLILINHHMHCALAMSIPFTMVNMWCVRGHENPLLWFSKLVIICEIHLMGWLTSLILLLPAILINANHNSHYISI